MGSLPDLGPVLRRLRRLEAALPAQETDPEVWDELRQVNDELSYARRRATSRLLGEADR